ncbi:ABC transporter permease [Nocardioides sp. AE5]|uniref:ABC transporter permease n=1 Tax=Nocardioides sp. AE5 TaxID=2962573 RepID=UPI002880C8EB|nr:ABC transporter permease [Nocardioides sp. AE5]MDT0203056.1 ABC transporter permease [Nocardioides sp. AE5]
MSDIASPPSEQDELMPTVPGADASVPDSGVGRKNPLRFLGFGTIGAVYVWIAMVVLFAIWIPDLWLSSATVTSIINEYSVTALATLSLVVVLAARQFDLSIGSTMSLGGVVAGYMLANTSLPPALCALVAVLSGLVVGLANAIAVVWLRLESLIATLGTGAIVAAMAVAISGDRFLTERMTGDFSLIAVGEIAGINVAFLYVIGIMVVMGLVLEHTPAGRHLYATGYNSDAARLMGVRVNRVKVIAFMVTGAIAAFAGVILAARLQAAAPDAGAHYLIPAFSAVFLGATQFRHGRFNSWGAVLAVLVIGTGSLGLSLAGGPSWAPEVFTGLILIIAVAITVAERKPKKNSRESNQ